MSNDQDCIERVRLSPRPRRTYVDFDERTSRPAYRHPGKKPFQYSCFQDAWHAAKPVRVFAPGDAQPDQPAFWDTHCRTPPVVSDDDPI